MNYWKNVGETITVNGIDFIVIAILKKVNSEGQTVPYYVLKDTNDKTPNDNLIGEYENELRRFCE